MNSVYVYDDKLILTYNYKDGSQTLTLQEINAVLSSDLTGICPPKRKDTLRRVFPFLSEFDSASAAGGVIALRGVLFGGSLILSLQGMIGARNEEQAQQDQARAYEAHGVEIGRASCRERV